MKVIKKEKKECLLCMEEHEVETIQIEETELFRDCEVTYTAIYEYCKNTDELVETEEMFKSNDLALKDSYRAEIGLLTSYQIKGIREKYGVSQKEFARILDWGEATIGRYETFQIQDRVHDDVLRKIDLDPKWYLELLKRAEKKLTPKAYEKYWSIGCKQFEQTSQHYLEDAILSSYACVEQEYTGSVNLNLNKIVELINLFAAKVSSVHKVKMMKMLWYADAINFKRFSVGITGLAYYKEKMGALPLGHNQIMDLEGVVYEELSYDNISPAYRFRVSNNFEIKYLTPEEIEVAETVIHEVGNMDTKGIVEKMHNEIAYKNVEMYSFIPFNYSKELSIN